MKIQYITNVRMPTEKAHGIQIAKACEAFATYGHDVELIVPKRRNPIKESAFAYYGFAENFKIRRVFTLDTVKWGKLGFLVETLSFAFSAACLMNRNELVYGRDEMVLAVLAFFGAKRVVWESHDGAWNRFAAYVAKKARAVVVVTQGAKTFYAEKGVPEQNILAVSNGVDLAAFAHPETKKLHEHDSDFRKIKRLRFIGRLDGWKGTDTLLEASKLLPDTVRVALIGGEPAQIAPLRARYPQILFLGYHPYRELADNQAAADVLVVPNTAKEATSVRFTSPLKLIAHLAGKRPIVASNLPSIHEIAGDSVWYVRPDDPQALAEGISRLLVDEPLQIRLAEAAQKKVVTYDWGMRAARILSFLTPFL